MSPLRKSRREQYAQAIAAGNGPPDAYRSAGYSTRGKGWHRNAYCLRDAPDIAARISELVENRALIERLATERAIERIALSKEGLAQELLPIVMANMADYFKFDEVGHPHLDPSGCTRAQMKAIKSIQIEEFSDGGGEEARRMRRCKIQLRDPVPAAMATARLFGWIMAPPRPEPPTPLEQRLRAMTPEQRRQDAKELYDRIRERLKELPPSAIEPEAENLETNTEEIQGGIGEEEEGR